MVQQSGDLGQCPRARSAAPAAIAGVASVPYRLVSAAGAYRACGAHHSPERQGPSTQEGNHEGSQVHRGGGRGCRSRHDGGACAPRVASAHDAVHTLKYIAVANKTIAFTSTTF